MAGGGVHRARGGWAAYNLALDPIALCQKAVDAVCPAAAAWAPGIGLAWGGALLVLTAVPAWQRYSRTIRGIAVAVTPWQVLQAASDVSMLTEALLTVPGLPAMQAVKIPLALGYVTGAAAWVPAYFGCTWPLGAMSAIWMGIAFMSKWVVYAATSAKPAAIGTMPWPRHLVISQAHPCACHQQVLPPQITGL